MSSEASVRDREIAAALVGWFATAARDLPWRDEVGPGRRDGYRSLVSELMLQQTQVSRVLEKFGPFLERFPTADALAEASEDDVLALWSGLGYYRRARLLHAAAKAVAERHGGVVPETTEELEALPGVGRYTAGAVASIAFGVRTPVVDGNVQRVLMRIGGKEAPLQSGEAVRWSWTRAQGLVDALADDQHPGPLNEGLMELGATVCTPKSPACGSCPVSSRCVAHAEGLQDRIPQPKVRVKKKTLHAAAVVVRDAAGRVLFEKRPGTGLWAGLWQCPAVEAESEEDLAAAVQGLEAARGSEEIGSFVFETTHRSVRFRVYLAEGSGGETGRWVGPDELGSLGLGSAQRRVLEVAGIGLG